MTEIRKINCIVCPLSCVGEVTLEGSEVKDVQGFTCERGKKYGREEVTSPKRMLTTTVKVVGGKLPLVPVISKASLPKEQVVACARYLSRIKVKAPIAEGTVVCENILNLGVDIIAVRDVGVNA